MGRAGKLIVSRRENKIAGVDAQVVVRRVALNGLWLSQGHSLLTQRVSNEHDFLTYASSQP